MITTATIVAYKVQDVAMVDISGEFMSAYMNKEVIVNLPGRIVELIVMTSPSIYKKYFTIDRVNKYFTSLCKGALQMPQKRTIIIRESNEVPRVSGILNQSL